MMNILLSFAVCAVAVLFSYSGEYVAASILMAAAYLKRHERSE